MKKLLLFTLLSISFIIKGQSIDKKSTLNVVTIHKADQTSNSRDGGYYTTYKPVDSSINGHVYAFNTFSNKSRAYFHSWYILYYSYIWMIMKF